MSGHEKVLYTFTGGADGGSPSACPCASLARDAAGNLYGTTYEGGAASGSAGFGVVYALDPAGQETVLYTFIGGADGANPEGGVVRDPAGNLYGTTLFGGADGQGIVFKVDPSGQETVLHTFTGGADGGGPTSGVVLDPAGNLYGTTPGGGPAGAGVVYMLNPSGQQTVLYGFSGYGAPSTPFAGVTLDRAGNVYGVAANGGITSTGGAGEGAVYKIDTAGNFSAIYTFTGGADGGLPQSNVVLDSAGNVYGVTNAGGVVYKISPSDQFVVLYTFSDGSGPTSLLLGGPGVIYGTGLGGALTGGFLFELQFALKRKPEWRPRSLSIAWGRPGRACHRR